MKKFSVVIKLILMILATMGCVNGPGKKGKMFRTSSKLINYMQICDTASIVSLFADKDYLDNKRCDISKDCRRVKEIIDRYGKPSMNEMILSKGQNEENIVSLVLMNKVDTFNNLKNVVLYISFYPDKLIKNTSKILDYGLVLTPLTRPKDTLIIAPPIKFQ